MHILIHSLTHALEDTLKMIPLLFIVFFLMEYLESKYGNKFNNTIKQAGKLGPLLGALLGIIPQCGISILAVGFYSERLITLGTMISVFISTSDEAIPLMISNPKDAKTVLPLIITKLVLGVLIGYSIDFIFKKNTKLALNPIKDLEVSPCDCCIEESVHFHSQNHDHHHGHTPSDFNTEEDHTSIGHIFKHSGKKLLKVTLYILIVTFILNILLEIKELSSLIDIGSRNLTLQILISSLIGLIPNCATSVALVSVYSMGTLSYSALISGLSANAGLALILLFREKENRKSAIYITLVLYLSAIICGFLTSIFF